MRVGLEIGTSDILGNEVSENRNGRPLRWKIWSVPSVTMGKHV